MTTAITKHPNIPTSSDKCPKGVATHLVATHIYRQVLQVLAICGINPTIRTEKGIKNALTKVHKAKDQWKATPTIVDVLTKTNHYANTYDTILNALPTYFKSHMKKRKKTDEKNHTSNSLYQVLSIMMYHFTNQVLNDDQLQQRKLLERGQYKGASTKSKSSKPFQLISIVRNGEPEGVTSFTQFEFNRKEHLLNLQETCLAIFHAIDTGCITEQAKTIIANADKLMLKWKNQTPFKRADGDSVTKVTTPAKRQMNPVRSSRKKTKTNNETDDEDEDVSEPASTPSATANRGTNTYNVSLVHKMAGTFNKPSLTTLIEGGTAEGKLVRQLKDQFVQLANSVTGKTSANCDELEQTTEMQTQENKSDETESNVSNSGDEDTANKEQKSETKSKKDKKKKNQ